MAIALQRSSDLCTREEGYPQGSWRYTAVRL